MRGKGAAKLKWVTREPGDLGASGACKKHLIPYYTATRTPLRGTPFLAAARQILLVIRFFVVFLKKLRNLQILKIYIDTPHKVVPGPTSGVTVYAGSQ